MLARTIRAVTSTACAVVLLTATWAGPAGAAEPTPPAQPPTGELGGKGPCRQSTIFAPNALAPANGVWVFQPTGDGTLRTGGSCDDAHRPVVFLSHGWSAVIPKVYSDVIENLTSNGFIVSFAGYGIAESALTPGTVAKPQIWAGFRQSTLMTRRMDLDHVGVWGHSYGGGMAPWILTKAADAGWGGKSSWLAMYDAWNDHALGGPFGSEPIKLPRHARALMVVYGGPGAGAEMFHMLELPVDQKVHVKVNSDCRGADPCAYPANHATPASWFYPNNDLPHDHLDYYGTYRNVQALADCARYGTYCDTDLSYMGTWSDGTPATPADVTHDPQP